MSEDDETPNLDFNEVYNAQIGMAEIIWAYYKALQNCGFDQGSALALVVSYQTTMLSETSKAG